MSRKKKKNAIVISVMVFSLILFGCTNPNNLENKQNTISEIVSDENTNVIEENGSEVFEKSVPFHQGIWEVRSYDRAIGWYEFSETYEGRKLDNNEADAQDFTYEAVDNQQVIFHFEEGDKAAEYRFGENGKIVTFSFEKNQITLFLISHGTLEDIGGLGLTFSVENITPTGCTLICQQSGGYVSGEIVADKSLDLLIFSGDSWGLSGLIGSQTDTVEIQKESTTEWVLDWSQYCEKLSPGRYYLCFQVRDVRNKGGDWDSFPYRVEFRINAE
ncbi:MAG: hypothetical protein IKP92_03400 [Lachnospiraceae bacterium]|nr:hypothetical protein [Lachnospiraceae bacterium]